MHRALEQTNAVDVTAGVARASGETRGDVGSSKAVDAVVAAVAAVAAEEGGRVVVLPSDPDDLQPPTEGRGDIAIMSVWICLS